MSNDLALRGKVAIVTGASRGIGSAIAQRLAAAGATVVIGARSLSESADGLAGTSHEVVDLITGRGGHAFAIACDVEDADNRGMLIEETVARFGRLDILVNNAGRAIIDPIELMDLPMLRSQTEQYVIGPVDLMLRAIPHMKAQGEGWIVNLGSHSALPIEGNLADHLVAERGLAYYGALKSAVHRFSKGFAIELIEHNIAVNVVAPVLMILTPGTEALGLGAPEMAGYAEDIEHIAEATSALVSREPRDQTGVVAFSYQYLDEIGRSTMSLDGRTVLKARNDAQQLEV